MEYEIIKSWKDEDGRRWYLPNTDNYPYISATSVVSVAKTYRYRNGSKDEKATKKLNKAADLGTDIHSVLEWHNRKLLGEDMDIKHSLISRHQAILDSYIKFIELISIKEGLVEIVEVERQCINYIYKYAGRFDVLVRVGGRYEIWDFKTSNRIHEEDGWQLAGYMLALQLEGIPVEKVRILHIDKITKQIKDLPYRHYDYMIYKFLDCMEIFKGIYFNDLLKGRINDIDELGVKYKWPLEELTKHYVLDYNLNKEKFMELKDVTGLTGTGYTKDPNRVDFNDEVIGVVLGNVPSRWVHKVTKDKVYACTGKDKCPRCKLGMKLDLQFQANMLVIDENDKPVIKKIVSESKRLFFALKDCMTKIVAEGGDLKTAVLKITRTGKSFDTEYKVENIAPKHKALQNVAETVKPLNPFELTFSPLTEDKSYDNTVRTDILES